MTQSASALFSPRLHSHALAAISATCSATYPTSPYTIHPPGDKGIQVWDPGPLLVISLLTD